MLDIHVLMVRSTPAAWVEQRRASIAAAAASAGYEVSVHEIPGEPGHIGRGRAAGYALGAHPYVTYIDDDDYLLEGGLSMLASHFAAGHDAIFPGELHLHGSVLKPGYPKHHLIAYRRDVATAFDHENWAACGDIALSSRTSGLVIDEPAYVHRIYESGGRVLRRDHVDEYRRAVNG